MSFLITNDDGIEANGIRTLYQALSEITQERIVIVAPKTAQSCCSHKVNIHSVIPVEWRTADEVSIDGTPADCIRLGVNHLYDDIKFVLSGINEGCNLGSDTYISGTVAAAREATLHRIRAISFSHFLKPDGEFDWKRAKKWAILVLEKLLAKPQKEGRFWMVNFPNLKSSEPEPEIIFCSRCTRPLLTDFIKKDGGYLYVGKDIDRQTDSGTDVDVCLSGNISIVENCLW